MNADPTSRFGQRHKSHEFGILADSTRAAFPRAVEVSKDGERQRAIAWARRQVGGLNDWAGGHRNAPTRAVETRKITFSRHFKIDSAS
jgi:hypothetical protein